MATYNYVGGRDGLWTDPQSWSTSDVPLWNGGSTIVLGAGGVTLHNIEPNSMTINAGDASAGDVARITLDNAAFGPNLIVRVMNPTLQLAIRETGVGIDVVGYDTNYGTIEVRHDQTTNGAAFLGVNIGAGSQLNNIGTITADGQRSDHSYETHLLFESGSSPASGILNNDGQINVLDDTIAFIAPAVIGVGTITLARPDGNLSLGYPALAIAGPVAASQTVELDAGQLSLLQPQLFEATIAGWNAQSQVLFAYGFLGNSLVYTPTSPDHGDLVVSGTSSNSPQAVALHLAGHYATSDFVLGSGSSGTAVSIHA